MATSKAVDNRVLWYELKACFMTPGNDWRIHAEQRQVRVSDKATILRWQREKRRAFLASGNTDVQIQVRQVPEEEEIARERAYANNRRRRQEERQADRRPRQKKSEEEAGPNWDM